MHMSRLLTLAIFAIAGCSRHGESPSGALTSVNTAQCGKDTDCKGERICTAGACVFPPLSTPHISPVLPPASPNADLAVVKKVTQADPWSYVQKKNGDHSWFCGDLFSHRVVESDLNGDGVKDTVVVFGVEGNCNSGNAGSNNVAVFLGPTISTVLHDRLNADGVDFDKVIVRERTLELTTLTRKDDDPQCCPSLAGKLIVFVSGGKVVQQQQ
jgi:hypothetical protein